ncbi:MAG: AbrB/MazE/SpoVT family DNA-binding domain-containing protein [Candidatus Gracilibacteria bacterium]
MLLYKYEKYDFSYLYNNIKEMLKKMINLKIVGTTSMGTRGQIVIPKEIRDKLNLEPGDNMVVLMKDNKYIGLVKNDNIGDLMKYITSEGVEIPGE